MRQHGNIEIRAGDLCLPLSDMLGHPCLRRGTRYGILTHIGPDEQVSFAALTVKMQDLNVQA